jgi:hypothetical protein
MSRRPYGSSLAALLIGLIYWQLVCLWAGVSEPWDAKAYGVFYAVSLGLSALLGPVFPSRAWLAGVLLVFAQLPVMVAKEGLDFGPLLPVGLAFLVLMAIPASLVSVLAWRIRVRRRGAD